MNMFIKSCDVASQIVCDIYKHGCLKLRDAVTFKLLLFV